MRIFRRRLASLALTVLTGHVGGLGLTAMALCCQSAPAVESQASEDCCPAGSHPGAVCPMHARKAAAERAAADSPSTDCRLVCVDRDLATTLLLGAAPLPQPPCLTSPLAAVILARLSSERPLAALIPRPPT